MHIGIDFGTSNTSAAYARDGRSVLIPLETDQASMPTAVFYGSAGDLYSTGTDAMRVYEAGEDGRLMRSIKSVLGTALIDETTQLGTRRLPFRRVIADFMRHTVGVAEEHLGREIDLVIQGRPVSFNDDDAAKDKRAQEILDQSLRDAGIADVIFLEEPVAAARSIAFPKGREKRVFVIDIGGGTSDFSVIRISPDNHNFEVLASTGVYVGGNDFDRLLSFFELATLFGKGETLDVNGLAVPVSLYSSLSDWKSLNKLYTRDAQKVLTWMKMNSPKSLGIKALDHLITHQQAHAYAASTETIKIGLSASETQRFQFHTPAVDLEKMVTRSQFEGLIADPVNKMEITASECLKRAGVTQDQVTDIVMVGGSTLIPFVAQKLAQRFGNAVISDSDRFSAVAKGLAAYGAAI